MGGIFGAFEPVEAPHTPAEAPPEHGFGLDTLRGGWKAGAAGTDWGFHQLTYESEIYGAFRNELKKRGVDAPSLDLAAKATYQRVMGDQEIDDLPFAYQKAARDSRKFWELVALERSRDPNFMKEFASVSDFPTMAEEARRRRGKDEQIGNEVYSKSSGAGKVAWWMGSFGTAAKDPISYIPIGGGATKAGTTAGAIIKGAVKGATINAGVTLALEPATRADAEARGQERGIKDTLIDLGLSAAFGGLLEGAHSGLEAKFGATADERAAANVAVREEDIREASPFERTGAGDGEHGKRLALALAALEAGQPVPQFSAKARLNSGTSLAGGADKFKSMVRTAESGGDDAARPIDPKTKKARSSAVGRFQFTDGTWLTYYKREIGAGKLTNAQILAKRTDGELQERLMDALTRDNQRMLASNGLTDTPGNLYMVHFLGPRGIKVLRAERDTPVSELLPAEFIAKNPEVLQGKTAGDVIAWADRKMGGAGVAGAVPDDVPVLRTDMFETELEYREALAEMDRAESSLRVSPEDGPDFVPRNDVPMRTVYHGSPHEFDRFSLDRVGTGEGAQSFGWGLYFAEEPRVAETYRLVGDDLKINGRSLTGDEWGAYSQFAESGHNIDQAIADNATLLQRDPSRLSAYHERQRLLEAWRDEPPEFEVGGRLYEAQIPDTESYLLWDRPLGEQPAEVRNALATLASRDALFEPFDPNRIVYEPEMTGAAALKRIELVSGGRREASETLRGAGLTGIKYLDGVSRTTGEGTFNYVVFDDGKIRIKTPEEVVAEYEAAPPRFVDPSGPDAQTQVDSIIHDLMAELKAPPIVRFRRDAAAIEANLPSVAKGFTRLWRGERPGANGKGLNFTNDLAGIALPFRKAYGGDLNYVDVPTADLPKYEMTGAAAPGAEFHLPAGVAGSAIPVPSSLLPNDAPSFRLTEDGGDTSAEDILKSIEADEAAIKAAKDCL